MELGDLKPEFDEIDKKEKQDLLRQIWGILGKRKSYKIASNDEEIKYFAADLMIQKSILFTSIEFKIFKVGNNSALELKDE